MVIAVDRQEWPNLHVGQPRESFSLVLGRLGRVQREPRGAPCAWAQSCVFAHDGFPPPPPRSWPPGTGVRLGAKSGCLARSACPARAVDIAQHGTVLACCPHCYGSGQPPRLSSPLHFSGGDAWRPCLPPFALSRRPAGAAGRAEGGSMPSQISAQHFLGLPCSQVAGAQAAGSVKVVRGFARRVA